jgi:hypothetical protein
MEEKDNLGKMIESLTFGRGNLNHFFNYLFLKILCEKDSSSVNHNLGLLIKKNSKRMVHFK